MEVHLRSGRQYYVEKMNIAAKRMGEMNTITVTDGKNTKSFRYGALSYVYTVLSLTGEGNIPIQNLCRSMYLYNQAAIAYFYK